MCLLDLIVMTKKMTMTLNPPVTLMISFLLLIFDPPFLEIYALPNISCFFSFEGNNHTDPFIFRGVVVD